MKQGHTSPNKRWYDKEPTLSLAVSFIKNSSPEQQRNVASKIIEKATANGVRINKAKLVFKSRWSDEDEKLMFAMEYFKESSPEDQQIIAVEVITFLSEIKK